MADKFKLGDRVRLLEVYSGVIAGAHGVVVRLDGDAQPAIQFDGVGYELHPGDDITELAAPRVAVGDCDHPALAYLKKRIAEIRNRAPLGAYQCDQLEILRDVLREGFRMRDEPTVGITFKEIEA
ncbi:hypothetical protein [Roseomonas sp. WA12]